ncbi:MAG: DUF2306 domain-containing protein [Proteobacteria bacterium]|nr:DUF2306 domain-containing protein [Pseudomonadota bacterium]
MNATVAVAVEAAAVSRQAPLSARALRAAAVSWFVVTALGQLTFAGYVAGFYGRTALAGRPELWNKVMPHGYVAGETFFNLVLGVHLAFAFVITVGGLMQLVPAIRRRLPALHRATGRVYLLAAALMAAGGLVMVWGRGAVGDLSQHVAISINAGLILSCATVAWRHARARRIDLHRRWALRLFLAVSGVWFFRVGLMLWIVVNQGPAGFDPKTFSGPFLTVLAFAAYAVLPLAVLEGYLRAQRSRVAWVPYAMASGIALLTLAMAMGVAAAAAILWLPRL